jgi:hypothetical protein
MTLLPKDLAPVALDTGKPPGETARDPDVYRVRLRGGATMGR